MRARIAFGLLVFGLIISMAGLAGPRQVVAQEPSGEGMMTARQDNARVDDLDSPNVNDYLWIAGSSFKPRSSDIQYDYTGNGCITSLTGGDALNQSFTAPLRVPNGSVIKGVRFYYYDTSAQDSILSITSYDGAGTFIDHVLVDSVGAAGAGNVYGGLSTAYTINTAERGFVLNWYPIVAGPTMQLCGARLFYDRSTPPAQTAPEAPFAAATQGVPASDALDPQAPQAYDYFFLAGSSFSRRDSNTAYAYGYSGCNYTASGNSLFTVDLNMPDGVRVLGARFYYYDTSASDAIGFFLTDYTGLGEYRDLLNGSSSDGGFGSVYVAMGGSYDPYTVDQFQHSLNAIAMGADNANTQLCGVRVFYQTPTALADLPAEQAAQAAEQRTAADVTPLPDSTALPAKAYAHDLQLPQGAVAEGLRFYYYNTRLPQGYVDTWDYNGATAQFLGTTTGTAVSGYASTYKAFTNPYTVDHFAASLGVVPWVVYTPAYRFCGVRVFYTEGATSRYRFIAGSAFHPRNSATRYSYEGTGCIAVTQSTLYIPREIKSPAVP